MGLCFGDNNAWTEKTDSAGTIGVRPTR